MLQNATSKKGRGGRRKLPFAFTEYGAVMAANVLNSLQAMAMSIYVVSAFIRFRQFLKGNEELAGKLQELEQKLMGRLDVHEEAIQRLFAEIRKLLNPPQDCESHGRAVRGGAGGGFGVFQLLQTAGEIFF